MRPAELRARVAAAGAGPGWRRAERAVGLADARAASLPESLPESRTRVHLALAGLVAVPQFEVRDDEGRWPARVDLAFPELRVALERDGAWHGVPGQLAEDGSGA
ncbi:hypothetical protein [Modestobacter sp. Leaf380]|uniref:hypothetical protein n=1 Tax=Modestobacter sp. Leaf380 TaxID=1736356 RepID=UPI0006F3162A|nr:hypothetical protein [Modestobacter sp. Leaf380]KQS73475.1 hypothetical protein ASG41_02155 [Modestobacter sp. Leaf380]